MPRNPGKPLWKSLKNFRVQKDSTGRHGRAVGHGVPPPGACPPGFKFFCLSMGDYVNDKCRRHGVSRHDVGR